MSGVSTNRVDIVDERGAALLTLPLEPRRLMSVKWSPDGSRVLIQSGSPGESDVWVYDMATRVTTRLTQTGEVQGPRWTPDGKRVAFGAFGRPGTPPGTPMWMPADGSAPAEPIAAAVAAGVSLAFDFSFGGRYLLAYTSPRDRRATSPLVAIPLAGGGIIPLLAGVTRPTAPRTSPDGRWMVYSSEEGERREVYLRPFPSGPGRLQLSTNGGDSPTWSRDGRRIFYRVPGAYRVATVDLSGAVPGLVRNDSLFADVDRKNFDVHPDGKRFAILRDAGEGAKLVVVTHWLDEALAKLRKHQ
jgi:Tol biopolymer transport system component